MKVDFLYQNDTQNQLWVSLMFCIVLPGLPLTTPKFKSICSSNCSHPSISQLTNQSQTITCTLASFWSTNQNWFRGKVATNSASHPLTFTFHQLSCSTHGSHIRQRSNMSIRFPVMLWLLNHWSAEGSPPVWSLGCKFCVGLCGVVSPLLLCVKEEMGGEAGESWSAAGVSRACLEVVFSFFWGLVSVVVCVTVSLRSSERILCGLVVAKWTRLICIVSLVDRI